MKDVKILHCGDIHIGAQLSSLGALDGKRRAEVLHTFERITQYCAQNAVDILLIAGDLFDSNRVDAALCDSVKRFLAALPHTAVFITPGNHDHLSSDSPYAGQWSENVHIFREDGFFEVQGVRIYGTAFCGAHQDTRSLPAAEGNGINILLTHADLDGGPYNPQTSAAIEKTGMDYVALGHVHTYGGIKWAGRVPYAYCGCPEPLGFDEEGNKGAILCTIGQDTRFEFIPFCRRRCVTLTLPVECEDNAALAEKLRNTLSLYSEDLVKVVLTGQCGFTPDTEYLTAACEDACFHLRMRDRTQPEVDLELLASEQTLKGIFVKLALLRINQADGAEKERLENALRLGLAAFDGREAALYADK